MPGNSNAYPMKGWLTRIYTYYALFVFALVLAVGLFFYILVKLLVPYRDQIKWVYAINKCMMLVWSPLTGNRFTARNAHLADRKKNYIVVMNHQNLIDMFAAARLLKIPGKPLIKIELLSIPLLGWLFAMAALAVTREDRESRSASYQAMVDELGMGISILIFPEGTRNRTDQPLIPFRDGAFRLAAETGTPLLPVVILNTRSKGRGGSLVFKPGRIEMLYLPPIHPADFKGSEQTAQAMKAACYQAMEEALLNYDPFFKTK
jgi:1-acyl-sn-glycerol-3-phosphate acyltransferase